MLKIFACMFILHSSTFHPQQILKVMTTCDQKKKELNRFTDLQQKAQSNASPITLLLSLCSQNNHLQFMFRNPQPEFLLSKKICLCAAFSSFQSYHSCLLNWPKAVNEDIDRHIDWNSFKKKRFLVICTTQQRYIILPFSGITMWSIFCNFVFSN